MRETLTRAILEKLVHERSQIGFDRVEKPVTFPDRSSDCHLATNDIEDAFLVDTDFRVLLGDGRQGSPALEPDFEAQILESQHDTVHGSLRHAHGEDPRQSSSRGEWLVGIEQRIHELTAQTCRRTLVVTIPAAAALALLGPWAITLWYGQPYAPAGAPLPWAAVGVSMMSIFVIITRDFTARGKQRVNTAAGLLALATNIALNVYLIPRQGIVGASLRSADTRDALGPQDGLYTLSIVDGDGERLRVIGSLLNTLVAPDDSGALLDAMSAPHIRIVTLTVTEKAYLRASTGNLNLNHPDIVWDRCQHALDMAFARDHVHFGKDTLIILYLVGEPRERIPLRLDFIDGRGAVQDDEIRLAAAGTKLIEHRGRAERVRAHQHFVTDRRTIDVFVAVPRDLQNLERRVEGVADSRAWIGALD